MATEIELSPDRTKMIVLLVKDGVRWTDRLDPVVAKHRAAVCRKAGVTDEWLSAMIDEVRTTGRPVTRTICSDDAKKASGFYVRGLHETREAATRHAIDAAPFLKEVLPNVAVEQVAEWEGKEALCCLDVDYHDCPVPPREWLRSIVFARLTPKPLAWHFSRGGGLHLFYTAVGHYAADELAAVAALRFRSIDGAAGLELKSVVRGPGKEEVVHTGVADATGAVFGGWFNNGETDEEERDEWLEREGMTLGGRYDHEKCPINPTPGYASKGDPVMVSEAGVYCHRCSGMGYALGCRRPGFAPWPAILGAPSSGDVGRMVRNLTHWGHARWVLLERYKMPEHLARLAYKAALKAAHADRPSKLGLIDSVWNPNSLHVARVSNQWYNINDSYPFPRDILPLLSTLPAVRRCEPDGSITVDSAAVCLMSQGMDLTEMGYPNVECIHGFKMCEPFLGPQGHYTQVGVLNPGLVRHSKRCAPRYTLKTERMPSDEAWAVMDTVVPQIDRVLVRTALAAFACAQETRSGMVPMVFVEGPTGSAKTSTLKIAAGIYGARTGDAVFSDNPEHFRQALYRASQDGPAVLCNELLKDAARSRHKMSEKDALDPVLNLTPDSLAHELYRGPVRFGRVPSVWITEPQCPASIRGESQLARRIRHWRLHDRKDAWKFTLAAAKLTDLHLIRTVSTQVNRACDAILSDVCDEFFSLPMTWDQIADELGVRTIEESPNFEDTTPNLLRLFKLVCEAPKLEGRAAERYGEGYKKVNRGAGEEDELVGYYSMFADGLGGDWTKSRKLQEKDWSAVLKVPVDVRFDMKTDGSSVYVRFASGPAARPTAVNEQIRKPEELL